MESRVKSLGHPIHQMLIPFPFGLLCTAVIFDIIYLIWGNPTMVVVSWLSGVSFGVAAVAAQTETVVPEVGCIEISSASVVNMITLLCD